MNSDSNLPPLLHLQAAFIVYLSEQNQTMKVFITVLLLAVFASCGGDYGKHVQLDNVTVYYTEGVEKTDALRLVKYWSENGFSGSNPQYMQLSKEKRTYTLKLIPTDSTILHDMPFQTQVLLISLEKELSENVFPKNKFNIVLSDNQFNKTTSITD